MKISDLIFAKNAPAAFRRPLIVISVIICIVWSGYFRNEVGDFMWLDPAAWLSYLIGLTVAAFVAPTALGIYFYLPPLGKNRKWEKLILIAGSVLWIGLFTVAAVVSMERSGRTLWNEVEDEFGVFIIGFLVFTFVPVFAFKILVWLWQGVRRQGR